MNSNDHNSKNRNGDDHPEPNLFNNSISYDRIRQKSKESNYTDTEGDDKYRGSQGSSGGDDNKGIMDEIMKNLDNLKTTETDMKFEYMANKEKLADNIKYFEKPNKHDTPSESTHSPSRRSSESSDSYRHTSSQRQSAPKPSSYGPSYGDGPSMPPANSSDKYQGFGSEEELNLAKLDMLRKLGELTHQHGVKLSQNYSMNSDYKAMKYEYELHKSIRDKHNGVKWLSNLMLNVVWGVELANENFNPFEFKLKGWSEQMNDDIDDYYDVLGELYEKYFKSGKPIPPELKLVLMIGGSAVKFHIAHTALGKVPTLSEALLNNPGLANKLNQQNTSDKVKEHFDKQKKAFDKKQDEAHLMAMKKAEDLEMLRKKQEEFNQMQEMNRTNQEQQFMQQQFMQQQTMQQQVMQQELFEKQRQLEELQKQLSLQRSDTRSNYTNTSTKPTQRTMNKPNLPASLRGRYTPPSKTSPGQYEYNDASNMGIGAVMTPDQLHEMQRQKQIIEHKRKMQEYNDQDSVSINKDIDAIIKNGFNDNKSRVSEEDSRDSRGSKTSRRSRGSKKPTIRIDTK